MIKGMKENTARRRCHDGSEWFLYILRCNDGTFYTGITKDMKARLSKHNCGKASRYTRTRRPVQLLYQEPCDSRVKALVRECQLKALPRGKKEELIARGTVDNWWRVNVI